MTVKIIFGFDENEKATSSLEINGEQEQFDYATLIKHLYYNPGSEVIVSIDDNYSDDERELLQDMANSLTSKVEALLNNQPINVEDESLR